MFGPSEEVKHRLRSLEGHLRDENPLLVDVVKSFEKLDRVGYRLGLLSPDQSFATQIPWWPLISVLGTFSAGKSTFINHYLQYPLQSTGTQAVDDKFTVLCYGSETEARVLPGIALDADPRFPFYQMSEELERVAPGEGDRIEAYLRLKTAPSERLRGMIMIDSPGFDADAQRTSTLRITNHIMDLSDLVLVFFDARHPEPGAMRDTLTHLVANTIGRRDSSKFLYILNQIDVTAREDNPEEVVAAWQRAIAQEGLTAGRFYRIYNPDAAAPIDDPALRRRFETKRDADLGEIHERIRQVTVERTYRIIGALEKTARDIEEQTVPQLRDLMRNWRSSVVGGDAMLFGLILLALVAASVGAGYWEGLRFVSPPWLEAVTGRPWALIAAVVAIIVLALWLHSGVRKWASRRVVRELTRTLPPGSEREHLVRAFQKNTRPWHTLFRREPVGWGWRSRRQLHNLLIEADRYVQKLNDRFANPSGSAPIAEQPSFVRLPGAAAEQASADRGAESASVKPPPAGTAGAPAVPDAGPGASETTPRG